MSISRKRDFWTNQFGCKYEDIETTAFYLAELALEGAIEIDNNLLGRNDDFSHIQELAGILEKYKLDGTENAMTMNALFPYLSVRRSLKDASGKKLETFPELALEMNLFRRELNAIPSKPERMKEMRSFLTKLHGNLYTDREYSPYGLTA